MSINIRERLVLWSLMVITISLLVVIFLLIPPHLPPAKPDLILPTSTLTLKNLKILPTPTIPSNTPTSLLTSTVMPMAEHQAIYLIQLRGLPDPEQRRRFIAVLNQILNRPVDVVYEYGTVYNGLAVKLTPQEAAKVAKLEQVRQVLPDSQRFPQDQSQRGNDRSTR
jgi:hypothetical protein